MNYIKIFADSIPLNPNCYTYLGELAEFEEISGDI